MRTIKMFGRWEGAWVPSDLTTSEPARASEALSHARKMSGIAEYPSEAGASPATLNPIGRGDRGGA